MAYVSYQNRVRKGVPTKYCLIVAEIDGEQENITVGYSVTKKDQKRDLKYEDLVTLLENVRIEGKGILTQQDKDELDLVQENDPKFFQRLMDKGLLSDSKSARTIKELFDAYFEFNRGVLKDRSVRSYRDDQRVFERFVGSGELIRNINGGTVARFEQDCLKVKCRDPECKTLDCKCKKTSYAKSTIGLKLKRVRQAFAFAVEQQWLSKNPIEFDAKKYQQKVQAKKQKEQARILTPENVQQFLNHQEADYERQLWKTVIYYLGCRPAELAIMRWSDVDFDPEDPTITFRSKDTEHTGRDRDNMPTRTSPLWNEIYDLLKKWRDLHPDETFIFNDIFNLRNKPEFELTNPETCERIREGRYESKFDTSMKKMIKRSGIPVYPQPHKALRDVRINELERQGFRKQEIDAWIGNTEAVRNKHYSATSVTKADRQKALGIAAGEKSIGDSAKSIGIVYAEDTQSDPNQLVQELLKTGKGRELLKMLEKALKESDPADLGEDAKYTRREWNPCEKPSVSA